MFDDGAEQTLKRSALLLRGGRHGNISECSDHQPLTANFGTPIKISSKKSVKRQRHTDQSPPKEISPMKNYKSSSEFIVDKVSGLKQVALLYIWWWQTVVVITVSVLILKVCLKCNTLDMYVLLPPFQKFEMFLSSKPTFKKSHSHSGST